MTYHPDFDCTPAQYHGAIDRLWKALDVRGPQQEDCLTLAAKEIVRLRERVRELEGQYARLSASYRCSIRHLL